MKRSLFLIALVLSTSPVIGETIVDGVVYPEITELGQLGDVRRGTDVVSPNARFAKLQSRSTGYRHTTIPPADMRPTNGPTIQAVPAYNQAGYGQGYTSVGTPPRVVSVQPAAYMNTLPVEQAERPITYVQPVTNLHPTTNAGYVNLQSLNTTTTYNPYAPAKPGVPWRPIVAVRGMPDNYVVGQGIVGQPKVYVPSQPVRNFLRYITP